MVDGLVSLFNDAKPRTIVTTEAFATVVQDALARLAYEPTPARIVIDGPIAEFQNSDDLVLAASVSEPSSEVEANDLAMGLSYARRFSSKLNAGVTFKYLYEKISLESANGYAFDFGFSNNGNLALTMH